MSGRRIFRPYGSGRVPKHLNSVAYPEEPATQATFGPSKANVPLSKGGQLRPLNTMSSAVNETMRSMLPSLDIRNTVSTSKEPAASVEMGAIKSVELTSPVAAEAPMNLATAMTARRNEIVLAQATTNEVEAIAQPYMAYKPPLESSSLGAVISMENNLLRLVPKWVQPYVLALDIFPYYPAPYIGQDRGLHSVLSITCSILYLTMIFLYMIYTLVLFAQRAPLQAAITESPVPAEYFFQPLFYFVMLSQGAVVSRSSNLVTVQMSLQKIVGSDTGNGVKSNVAIEMAPCTNTTMYKSNPAYSAYADEGVLWCPYSSSGVEVGGQFGYKTFKYVSIKLNIGSFCPKSISDKNVTRYTAADVIKCENSEPFKSLLKSFELVLYMPTFRDKFGTASVARYSQRYIGPGWSSSSNVYIVENRLTDYSNVYFNLFQTPNVSLYYTYRTEAVKNTVLIDSSHPERLLNINVECDYNVVNEIVYVTNFFGLLADWGGFISLFGFAYGLIFVFNFKKFQHFFTWDIELPATSAQAKSNKILKAHRVLDAKVYPVNVRGEPAISKFKKYDPPSRPKKQDEDDIY